jgi:transcriptional regulator with XRE-family HTH domain
LHKTLPATRAALKALGQVIRAERERQKLSRERFAELADVHWTYVGKVERAEKNISFENLLHMARALGLKLSELIARARL